MGFRESKMNDALDQLFAREAGVDGIVRFRRQARRGHPTFLFLHGLGGSALDFSDLWQDRRFAAFGVLALDFPGHGKARRSDGKIVDLQALIDIAARSLKGVDGPAVVVGHSLGGLVGLLMADRAGKLAAFVNIEGNLTGEDCGYVSRLSAQVSLEEFRNLTLPALKLKFSISQYAGDRHYAEGLDAVDPAQYHALCGDIVQASDSGELLDRFLKLRIPRLYIRGAATGPASYLARLEKEMPVAIIADAGHFAFVDNPGAVLDCIAAFLGRDVGKRTSL
jgi:pimeloyl-ACP methyl ester carboxylesterase